MNKIYWYIGFALNLIIAIIGVYTGNVYAIGFAGMAMGYAAGSLYNIYGGERVRSQYANGYQGSCCKASSSSEDVPF